MVPVLIRTIGQYGFVSVEDVLGSDVTVVNAARVSFGKKIIEIQDKDIKLLKYLSKEMHTAPFRHITVQFHVKAPEFVARQWYKHIIGGEYTFKDCAWNEISGRYVEYAPEFWIPTKLRKKAPNKKQGSLDESVDQPELFNQYKASVKVAYNTYMNMLEAGVAPEIARTILPMNYMTEWYWTCSLQATYHFVCLRGEEHAQEEIRLYAQAIDGMMDNLFPHAWAALMHKETTDAG